LDDDLLDVACFCICTTDNFMGGYEFFLDQEFMTFSWAA
jgi:hypothetical protein